MLSELQMGMGAEEIMQRIDSGMPKLWVIYNALRLRREHPEWFRATAGYTPLLAEGQKQEHVVAYIRGNQVVTIVPRWTLKLGESWAATTLELPGGKWKNPLTSDLLHGGRIRVHALMQHFPVALLTREAE
jgi:(1->4)-alpha-D-glucan 1-alpha-D-glucosylmutase